MITRHRHSTQVQMRSGSKTVLLPRSEIKTLTAGVVCYHPTGKYQHQGSRVIPISEIPEFYLTGDRRIDLREQCAEPGQTWWPVTIIEFHNPHKYPVPAALQETETVIIGHHVTSRVTGIWVICAYQWIEVEVWAWPTRLAHWVNM